MRFKDFLVYKDDKMILKSIFVCFLDNRSDGPVVERLPHNR